MIKKGLPIFGANSIHNSVNVDGLKYLRISFMIMIMFMKCSKGFVRAVIYTKWLCFSCGEMTHALRKDGKLEIKGGKSCRISDTSY